MKELSERSLFRLSGAREKTGTAFLCVAVATLLGLGLSAGCGESKDEPFLIGLSVLDVPGFREMRRAAEFAAADINAAGGNVRLVDSELDNEVVFRRADPADLLRGLLDTGVRGLIPTTSQTGEAIMDFITQNRLVTIAPGSSSDRLTELNREQPGQHYFFRTLPHNDYQAKVLADLTRGKVAVIYRDDGWGQDLEMRIREHLTDDGRPTPVSVKLPRRSGNAPLTDAEARELVRAVEGEAGIRDADSVIIVMWGLDARIITHLRESTIVPENAGYYLAEALTLSQRLHSLIAKEGEDPESAEVKARLDGFTGVIPYPHSPHDEDLRNFECRFPHDIEYVEEALHFATYAYDAVVVMALASLAAGSADPSRYVHEVANVTKEGEKCTNYAECRGLLTDGDPSNDDIDYEGLSGPLELDPDTGNVTDAFFAVYTYDGTTDENGFSGRVRDFEEVRDGELRPLILSHEKPERPLRECPEP